jgi:phage-related protein
VSADGEKPVAVFLKQQKQRNPGVFKKCVQYIEALEEHGLALPQSYIRHIDGDVWELRPEFGGVEYRIFFGSIAFGEFGLVSAYQKTWEKVPDAVKKTAAERISKMKE